MDRKVAGPNVLEVGVAAWESNELHGAVSMLYAQNLKPRLVDMLKDIMLVTMVIIELNTIHPTADAQSRCRPEQPPSP